MKNTIFASLTLIALIFSSNYLCFAQISPTNQSQTTSIKKPKQDKIKEKVEKIGIGGKITVFRSDKKKFYGKVTSLDDEGFQILEVDLKTTIDFKYSEISKITTGDGEKNLITGKRANPKKGWLYGLAIFGALFVILAVALSDKEF